MNVLVTGGAGYVGSHTCKLLKERGHSPVVLDNLTYGHEYAVQWGPLVKGDIRDHQTVISLCEKFKIDSVIHFAAYALVGESVKDPAKYFDNNVIASYEFLQALLNGTKVRKLVFSSSCAVYGLPTRVPIFEDEKKLPINPYGQNKLAVEQLLQSLCAATDLKAVALRYFNAAGADPEAKIGEDHHPETHLIPLAIAAALKKDFEMTVFGDDYATEDGTCVRDYVHVLDLAEAHLASLAFLDKDSPGFSNFNVGTGQGFSVKEIIAEVERLSGRLVKRRMGPRRPGDPDRLVANSERLRSQLGWEPRHSTLPNIVETALKWHRQQFKTT